MKTLLILFLSVFAVSAQPRCSLTLAQSPTIRGLKLGMTKDAVENVIPPTSGVKLTNFAFIADPNLAKLNGFETVQSVHILFRWASLSASRKETIDELTIKYKPLNWDSIDEFADNIATHLDLPRAFLMGDDNAEMRCKDFTILLRPNLITLRATDIENTVNAENERLKKAFKP